MENTNGGFRLIALDCTLHCLVAKIASCFVMKDMVDLLSPRQLGYGVRVGVEAAVHAAMSFLSEMPLADAMVKINFKTPLTQFVGTRCWTGCWRLAPVILQFCSFCLLLPFMSLLG